MKLTACGVTFSAAMIRSPSFSRSASSTTITILPFCKSAITDSMVLKRAFMCEPVGRWAVDQYSVEQYLVSRKVSLGDAKKVCRGSQETADLLTYRLPNTAYWPPSSHQLP